jgi:hypothetical protein
VVIYFGNPALGRLRQEELKSEAFLGYLKNNNKKCVGGRNLRM